MSKIDLAIAGTPSRQPATAAFQRNARLWLSLVLLLADMMALAAGFVIGLRVAGIPILSMEVWQPLAGGILVYGTIAFHNQAYNPRCLTSMTASCRSAVMAFAGTLLIFLLVVFSLKVTDNFSRLGISTGLFFSGALIVMQRVLVVRAVRRHFAEGLFAQLLIIDDGLIPDDVNGMTIVDAHRRSACAPIWTIPICCIALACCCAISIAWSFLARWNVRPTGRRC